MILFEDIQKPIHQEMQMYSKTLTETLHTESAMLQNVNEYISQKSGNMIRPLVVLLCAKLWGNINQSTINAAISLEFLHIASLIHNDVLENNPESEESLSKNNRWINKIATLSGDYILSKSLECGTRTKNNSILNTISEIGMQLADGELLQLTNESEAQISEENYLAIAKKKTAALLSGCAKVGCLSVDADSVSLEHLRNFGENLGLMLHIKNDELEFRENATTNSTFGKLKVGVNVDSLIQKFKNKAIDELNGFANCDVKQSLIMCVEYAGSSYS